MVSLIVIAVALLACNIPEQWATEADPMIPFGQNEKSERSGWKPSSAQRSTTVSTAALSLTPASYMYKCA